MNYILNRVSIASCALLFSFSACNNSTPPQEENTQVNSDTMVTETPQQAPIDTMAGKPRDTFAIETTMGTITVELYNETPRHKANFEKLVKEKFYDGVLFHRVIKNFMIQTGDPTSKNAKPGMMYGNGGPGYTIPNEISVKFVHQKGALAAARLGDEINPNKESSGSQFYICHIATPMLDGQYTVFGQTVSGFDVIDKIATSPTLPGDRPVTDIKIKTIKQVNSQKVATKDEKKPEEKVSKEPIKE